MCICIIINIAHTIVSLVNNTNYSPCIVYDSIGVCKI